MTRYVLTVCPGCGRRYGINGNDIHAAPTTRAAHDAGRSPARPRQDPLSRRAQRRSPEAIAERPEGTGTLGLF